MELGGIFQSAAPGTREASLFPRSLWQLPQRIPAMP
jgi:hypothetical protein